MDKAKKYKILKIIFYISLIPYVFLICYSIYNSIFGFDFLFSKSYGWDAAAGTFVIYGLLLVVYIPIIPICLIYDIVYVVLKYNKSRKEKDL